jgi:trans-2,3-dihydro-3-hydroxyanthranilate isomerase
VAIFRYVVADVFTDTPLTGNQVAVFTDAREIPQDKLLPLAREMAFSETVFVYPRGWEIPAWDAFTRPSPQSETASQGALDREGNEETVFVYKPEQDGHVRIRIFTPKNELPFAGHPTLGTAFVLGGPLQLSEIRLETGAGVVPVRLEREGARIVFGWMSQPIPTWRPYERADELLNVLGVESQLPVEAYDLGPGHVYVALSSAEEVAALRPDFGALEDYDVGVNCFARNGGRWKTRMFAPSSGVAEDPATGSAAGPLAVHLLRHGWIDSGQEIEIDQGAEIDRPSRLHARADGTADRIDSVEVGGSAVIVARGDLQL